MHVRKLAVAIFVFVASCFFACFVEGLVPVFHLHAVSVDCMYMESHVSFSRFSASTLHYSQFHRCQRDLLQDAHVLVCCMTCVPWQRAPVSEPRKIALS